MKPRYFRCFGCGECIQYWTAWERYRVKSHKMTCAARKIETEEQP